MQSDFSTGKRCSRCGETFDDVEANFHRNRSMRDGFSPYCKPCKKATNHSSEEAKERKRNASRERMRRIRAENPEKEKATKRAYYERHRDEILARDKDYRERSREKVNARSRRYHQANRQRQNALRKERYREADGAAAMRQYRRNNAEHCKAIFEAWKETNPNKLRLYAARQRVIREGAPGNFTVADVERIYCEQFGLCKWCGVELGETYHVDHIIALSRGGTNWPDNLCIACPPCNQRKWAHSPEEFLRRLRDEYAS